MKISQSLQSKINEIISDNNININVADLLVTAFSYTDIFNVDEIKQYIKEGLNEKEAMMEIFTEFFDIDYRQKENEEVMDEFILNNLVKLNDEDFINNEYVKAITSTGKLGKYTLRYIDYKPYQLFPYDDIILNKSKEMSRIGYFDHQFSYLALCENNNIWMSLNPNEITTMKPYISKAKGNVLVLGLGMGYVPFMMAIKNEVKSITIIEKDPEIISLFKSLIWPNFKSKDKFKIIQEDAIKYMQTNNVKYDYVFADLWHDALDGLSLFVNLKRNSIDIDCWLQESMYALLRRCMITLLEETLLNMDEQNYKHAKNYTDKVINKYYQKTKNLILNNENDLFNLLDKKTLLNLLID